MTFSNNFGPANVKRRTFGALPVARLTAYIRRYCSHGSRKALDGRSDRALQSASPLLLVSEFVKLCRWISIVGGSTLGEADLTDGGRSVISWLCSKASYLLVEAATSAYQAAVVGFSCAILHRVQMLSSSHPAPLRNSEEPISTVGY